MSNAEQVTISLAEYTRLVDNEEFLCALQAAGVDNWEGYGIACELHSGELDEEDL